jgi:hypothetical protein
MDLVADAPSRRVERCRVCGSTDLALILDLGTTPLANAFVRPDRAAEIEQRFPLETLRCGRCGLVQLSVVVRPDILFRDYLYASSASAPLFEHFSALASEVAARFAAPGSLVVEFGSNDGVLLRALRDRGLRPLGVEPATNLAAVAEAAGLETWNEFFGPEVARRIAADRGRAAAVLANNVLAHIDDVRAIAVALDALLDADGVFIAEVPYLGDLIEHVEYDTIYHEHLSYFAVHPLAELFRSADLELFDVRRLPIHGGSIRMFVGRAGRRERSEDLARILDREAGGGLLEARTYADFASRVARSRDAIREMLGRLRSERRRVAALGATAKGNTLLNYCGIGTDLVEFVADTTPFKQGLLTPGMHIPVRPEAALLEERPDYALMLAWNYADAIVRKHARFIDAGGHFIHPIPMARIYA